MKKLLSLTLALITLLALAVVPASSATVDLADTQISFFVAEDGESTSYYDLLVGVVGDCDLDNTITIMDATMIQEYIAKRTELDPVAKWLADTNRDDSLNVLDATQTQLYIAQLDTDSAVSKNLYGAFGHTTEEYKKFDEIVGAVKTNGSYNGNSAYPTYTMSIIGITEANDGYMYGGNSYLIYEPNWSMQGNTGSFLLKYEMYNEQINSPLYEIEFRFFRGLKIFDVYYTVSDRETGEVITDTDGVGFVTGNKSESGEIEFVWANQETYTYDDYFYDKEQYDLYISPMLEAMLNFSNGCVAPYTDVKFEDVM